MRKIVSILLIAGLLVGCSAETKQYDQYVKDGKMALVVKQYDNAIELFEKALVVKPEDESAAKLLEEAKAAKEANAAELAATEQEEIDMEQSDENTGFADLQIEEKDGEFFINGITLLMTMEEVISKWGEPDSIKAPDLNDDYYASDYEEWNFLHYGDIVLTIYSDQLRGMSYETGEFVFTAPWYENLGEPDESTLDANIFYTDLHYLSFSTVDPYIEWGELDPKPKEEAADASSEVTDLYAGMTLEAFTEAFNVKYAKVFEKVNEQSGNKLEEMRLNFSQEDIEVEGSLFTYPFADPQLTLIGYLTEENTLSSVGLISKHGDGLPKDENEANEIMLSSMHQIVITETLIQATNPNTTPDEIEYIFDELVKQQYKEFKDEANVELNGYLYSEKSFEKDKRTIFLIEIR